MRGDIKFEPQKERSLLSSKDLMAFSLRGQHRVYKSINIFSFLCSLFGDAACLRPKKGPCLSK